MKRIDIRISEETKQKLEQLAKEEHRSMTKEIISLIEKRHEEVMDMDYIERVISAKKDIRASDECYKCDDCIYNDKSDRWSSNGRLPCGQYRCEYACEIASAWDVSAFDV